MFQEVRLLHIIQTYITVVEQPREEVVNLTGYVQDVFNSEKTTGVIIS